MQMVRWSEEVRRQDPNVFLRAAITESEADRFAVWILVDARRECDLQFFQSFTCPVLKVRIEASEDTRIRRGWKWTQGVDDQETECGLDHVKDWNLLIQNDDLSEELLLQKLEPIISLACSHTPPVT